MNRFRDPEEALFLVWFLIQFSPEFEKKREREREKRPARGKR